MRIDHVTLHQRARRFIGRPQIEYLKVENYRALKSVELTAITPLTVLIGPNGSGKSTLFDVFSFLSECFRDGLRAAWEQRGKARELKTRGASGPVMIEIKYRERARLPLIHYHLSIDEGPKGPIVVHEWMQWNRKKVGRPFRFLDYREGIGEAVSGEKPDEQQQRRQIRLDSPDLIAVNALGQFADHPRVSALRRFITDWYVSHLSVEATRGQATAGPQEHLSPTGSNLSNVVQFLEEEHPETLAEILSALARRVPRLESVLAKQMSDGRLHLQLKDGPFERPILSQFASDGTLKMLAYLVILYDPSPPRFIGIEEPENFLYPQLLQELAEECRMAGESSQILVTTHSPFFLSGLRPTEVRVLSRDTSGYTRVVTAVELEGIPEFIETGADLGQLWMEGRFRDR